MKERSRKQLEKDAIESFASGDDVTPLDQIEGRGLTGPELDRAVVAYVEEHAQACADCDKTRSWHDFNWADHHFRLGD